MPRLADEVLIPAAVFGEILSGSESNAAALSALLSVGWARQEPTLPVPPEVAGWDLGAGETQVLTLARARGGLEVVLDDLQARRCAKSPNRCDAGSAAAHFAGVQFAAPA